MFLRDLIDKFYLDKEKEKAREQDHFYITDAGKCGRALFFKFKNVPRREIEASPIRKTLKANKFKGLEHETRVLGCVPKGV